MRIEQMTMGTQQGIWREFYVAAITTGKHTPEGAAKFADEAMKHYRERHDSLGKLERTIALLAEKLRVRTNQEHTGTMGMMAARNLLEEINRIFADPAVDHGEAHVRSFLRSFNIDELRRWDQNLHLWAGKRLVIVPPGEALPEEYDRDHDLVSNGVPEDW